MPPIIAALICILLIIHLFWVDRKNNDGVSKAIWIPLIWMLISGSRFVSYWFNLTPLDNSADSILDGSPIDRAVFTLLIISGVLILRQRSINWKLWFTSNAWIWLYFVFGAVSLLWSDYPFVAFKRLLKALGTVIMVLVILTEELPYVAIGVILKRIAFVLLPISVLFGKYYPELGRTYHFGQPLFTGVATEKNTLGLDCLLSGIYFSWNLFLGRWQVKDARQRLQYSVYFVILPMIAWLFLRANSATSLACLIAAIGIFVVGRQSAIASKPQIILPLSVALIALYGILEIAFDINDTIISILGRRPDLTTRVPMWENLLSMVGNPIVGYGYESFWLGERRTFMYEHWGITSQAHNGYLEMYLNMGLVGLFFVLGWIVSGLKKVQRHLQIDYPVAMLRFCFIIIVVLYNWTEAVFFGNTNMWLLFFLGIMDVPNRRNFPNISEHMEENTC